MRTVKLTLSADPLLIADVKRIAQQRQSSISALFGQFVRHLQQAQEAGATDLSPLTRRALGVVASRRTKRADRDILADALLDKHGVRK